MPFTTPPIRCCLTLLLSFAPLWACAQALSVKLENDILSSGGDGHYSNGLEVFWSFEPEQAHWTRRFAHFFPGWSASEVDNVAYRFGHQIYTPDNLDTATLIEDDRPYAGLIFAGWSVFADEQHDGWRQARDLHLDVGVVGPASGAEKVQRAVHRLTDSNNPEGWDNQLENEVFINLAYTQRWWLQERMAGLELEYGPSLSLAAGNLYSYAASGLGVRFGQGLARSLSVPSVTPAQSGSRYFQPGGAFGWYLFANLEGRYMAHNLLLDGNTFESSHSVDSREWVGDAQVGVALNFSVWQLAFANVWRSREFAEQREHDQFGSLTITTWLD